jgi:hypothetical protein
MRGSGADLALGPRLVHGALAFWMQTTGATLLATKRRSLVRVLMVVHDGRCAHGLLYLAAVRDDRRELERGQVQVDGGCFTHGSGGSIRLPHCLRKPFPARLQPGVPDLP